MPDGLTIDSPTLIDLPALCAECGEPTTHTTKLTIDIKKSRASCLFFLVPSPFREIIVAAWEFMASRGLGPKSTAIPMCKACTGARQRSNIKMIAIFATAIALVLVLIFDFDALAGWIIALGWLMAGAIAIRIIVWNKKYSSRLPVKIARDRRGYHYHFHSGVYRALAEREGIRHANLANPPAPASVT